MYLPPPQLASTLPTDVPRVPAVPFFCCLIKKVKKIERSRIKLRLHYIYLKGSSPTRSATAAEQRKDLFMVSRTPTTSGPTPRDSRARARPPQPAGPTRGKEEGGRRREKKGVNVHAARFGLIQTGGRVRGSFAHLSSTTNIIIINCIIRVANLK